MNKFLTLSSLCLAVTVGSTFAATVFTEDFSYADGSLTAAAGSQWVTNSGTAGQQNVAAGAVELTSAESEDTKASATYGAFTDGLVVVTLDVNFSALPSSSGAYFFHLIGGTNSFVGRVWATVPAGSAPNTLRLAISNSSNTQTQVPVDLSLGTTYMLTLTLDAATGISSLAVGSDPAVTAADPVSIVSINNVGLRQASGIGTMTIDNISINTIPVPEPSVAFLGLLGGLGLLRRRRA